ncbi:squalene synthase HpnC [Nocardia sp. NPDC020380]|uniref:squalene synthase HpnC n=1 Tax=Nocardia sp. NPDC020380 TaxID=3364309 RepID=UPI0037AD8945
MSATVGTRRLRAAEQDENFPVALRCLPREPRRHLHAIYAVARWIDDVGDQAAGDRTAQLLTLRTDLARIWAGSRPQQPVLVNLATTVADCRLPQEPFQQLIEANLIDQRVHRYATFEDLMGYCRLSADPVGHLVLQVFDQSTPQNTALSNRVCSALQVLEHCQDVAEDHAAGRIYLPQRDLDEFGVSAERLGTGTDPGSPAVVSRQVDRATDLLDEGSALAGRLTGWARLAVTGYIAGGYATARALRAADGDVWTRPVRPRRADVVRSMLSLLTRGRAAATR